MDDWLDPILEEPWFQQHPDHLPVNLDVYAAPEAAEVIEPAEVLAKIKAFILEFTDALFMRNSILDIPVGMVNTQHGPRERVRSLLARQGQGADAYTRIFAILSIVHELLIEGKTSSQRDIYYRLKVEDLFKTPQHVITAIREVCGMLEVPRHALGITCASRGTVFGPLMIQEGADGSFLDCSVRVQTIPGHCGVVGTYLFQSTASFLVIVEKDAIFQRLLEDGFPELAQAIVVTAKGMPDLATRAFLHALISALPHLRPVAVVDWNPSGAHIYSVYKHGSSTGQGSQQHTVPNLEWVAVRAGMLGELQDRALQGPLSARDKALIASLKAGPLGGEADAIQDLDAMEELDAKAEVEALFELESGMGGFSRLLADDLQELADIQDAAMSL